MARRFQFRLQTLLEVRQLREREAKRNVAAKSAEIARIDQLNIQTRAEISQQQDTLLASQKTGALDPVALQRGQAWIAHLRRTIADNSRHKAGLLEQLDDLQARLRAARQQTRIIDKLRQRRRDEYVHQRNRAEQAVADELAQQLQGYEET